MRTRLSQAAEAPRRRGDRPMRFAGPPAVVTLAVRGALIWLGSLGPAFAQVDATLNGAPVQVRPYVPEPGVPAFTVPTGTPNPPPTSGAGGASTGGGGNFGGSEPLTTLMSTSWGLTAVSNAQTVGVNPSALAATCVLESGCQNIGGTSSITGAFQMTSSTYTAMMNQALADNPSLASQIVPGLAGQNDPATQSIAASEYLLQGAQYLQSNGISDPSVLDVRGYFNFGPTGGASIANATDSQTMASVLPNYSAATLQKNGISPGETVGQWRASVSSKIGTAANQSVIT